MPDESSHSLGLVAQKKKVRARQLPRLLMRMVQQLPAPPATKAQRTFAEQQYITHDHFDFEQEQGRSSSSTQAEK